jgi:Lysine methyltransferase
LFSPSLYLAERIERGLLSAANQTGMVIIDTLNSYLISLTYTAVIELGAGSGLPSLLLATLSDPPSLTVITDYPDPGILGNLKKNVEQNKPKFQPGCNVECEGYEWGTNVEQLL